jgi:hypothetical protein
MKKINGLHIVVWNYMVISGMNTSKGRQHDDIERKVHEADLSAAHK